MSDPNTAALPAPIPAASAPAGWYPQAGQQRYWDGTQWTDHWAPLVVAPPVQYAAPAPVGRTANGMGVSYVRPQTGHSLLKHLLLGWLILYIDVIYISVSPNHYWHA